MTEPYVVGVSRSASHRFSKDNEPSIRLVAGVGVEGDCHAGATVRHRSRVRRDPSRPNLRQVHLIHAELHDELAAAGFLVGPGELGENITTRGVDLLALSRGTRLHLGEAVVEVTGLRNPCHQIEDFQRGLLAAVLVKAADGTVVRKTGVMTVVVQDGRVEPGDSITVESPEPPYRPLETV